MGGLSTVRRWFHRDTTVQLSMRDAYALWAKSYPARAHNPLMEAEQAVVAPILTTLTPTRALDLGTGTGRNLSLLASTGARLIVGLDLSPAMLERGELSTPRICADASELPFASRSFDLISSSLMVGDVKDVAALVMETARVLAPGGHLVYSDLHPTWSDRHWRRTFRAEDGWHCELPYFPHSMEQHLEGLSAAGLQVQSIREPRVGEHPAVVVFHAMKAGLAPRRFRSGPSPVGVGGPPGPLPR